MIYRRTTSPLTCLVLASALAACGGQGTSPAEAASGPPEPVPGTPSAWIDSIPGTLVTFEMVPVPGGSVTWEDPDGTHASNIEPFDIGRTEVTWDMYDIFALGLDTPGAQPAGADAIARPSRPYGAPDYGWGHRGFPVMSVTREAAEAFCRWLSEKTGRRYRLPTEAEWMRAASLATADATGARGPAGTSGAALAPDRLDALAWHAGNAEGTTHAVATREPDALGLHDLLGNVGEWVATYDGVRVLRGGSFRDAPGLVARIPRATQDPSWRERDPQLPGSRWWLTDAPFAGFRVVRER